MRQRKGRETDRQLDLFADWSAGAEEQVANGPVISETEERVTAPTATVERPAAPNFDQSRYRLAVALAEKLNLDGEISSGYLTQTASTIFGGTLAEGIYTSKDAYDAMEAAVNLHLTATESRSWASHGAEWAAAKAEELNQRIQRLPTQTRRDPEMDEYQQFSTPPALAFVANWVANVQPGDRMLEPSAGTGDLAVWSQIAGADIILNELAPRRHALLSQLFPDAALFRENAEQLDNVLPLSTIPSVIVMNPPFSSTAGRVQGQRDTANGARHIEQALKRLAEGGRLVAIVGQGMAADRPAFRGWWKTIQDRYSVRANVGIDGREYAKYGTTFDNQILVIDKLGPTTQPVLTGQVASVAELPALLETIRYERRYQDKSAATRGQDAGIQPGLSEQAGGSDPQEIPNPVQRDEEPGRVDHDSGSAGPGITVNTDAAGTGATDSQADGTTEIGDGVDDGMPAGGTLRDRSAGESGTGRSGSDGTTGNNGSDHEQAGPGATVLATDGSFSTEEFSESVFSRYQPQRLRIPDAHGHPGKLVQSAAMAAVEPPMPGYAPALPLNVVRQGLLSIAQLEAIVYAGQAHNELLPNGSRKGFFIGDGTGVGKGREISGIILDNLMQGRKKAVWISFNEGLINDARRDYAAIGGDPDRIVFQGKTKAGNPLSQPDGILFTTYTTLGNGGERKQSNDLGQVSGRTRLQQLVEWLGKDFDGVIAFDEAHSMGNALALKGKRGVKKPAQQAIAGVNLQRELPNARVVYVSATGATEVSNLSYADRLGLWGEGTPFADVAAFVNGVSAGGIAAMELISRDMKAMGMYLARSLSYDGVSYERMEHALTPLQEDIYNELAGAWQVVLNNVEQALDITNAGKDGGSKSAAMAKFWGSHQRFFNQVITAMQTPAVIDHIRQQLDAGHVAVIQLVNTNEASQERIVAEATAGNIELEDLDFTPRQMLIDYVRNGFPVAAFEETVDSDGKKTYSPVTDAEGKQVFDREAIALREALLETLQNIRVPENPLDSIINTFGPDMVAEVTGRGRRFVQLRDDEGNLRVVEEKRGKNSTRVDADLFQQDKKKILVFSGAGGTGYSFHADNTAANTRKRIHYILQPGWRADAAVQGFGRTHRTNQASEPHYVLPTTNLKAQKRFVSSIARRLDQLGALTRGQRQATSQGMFTAADNLESDYAKIALRNFFTDLYRERTPLDFETVSRQMGLNLSDQNGTFEESKIPEVPQFLNRLLSLKTDQQNAVFDEFENRLIEAVEYAKQHGVYDEGLQTLRALNIKKMRDEVAYEHDLTGAKTRYVELTVTNALEYHSWEDMTALARARTRPGDLSGWFVSEHGKDSGSVFFMADRGERLDSKGNTVHRGIVFGIRKNGHRHIDNAIAMHRGWDYRHVNNIYSKVTLTRKIDVAEAEQLWKTQVEAAPKTETKTKSMLVGVILPIWDRVEGSEKIFRLQTDEGEQLLGRMLDAKAARQTLKNLGMDSAAAKLSAPELFKAIQDGQRAVLSNGWEISTSVVNREDRIEIKGRISEAESRLLVDQGAFIERINWRERLFIPNSDGAGLAVFQRITASKPVIDLFEKARGQEQSGDLSARLPTPTPSAEESASISAPWDVLAQRRESWKEDRWFQTRVRVSPGMNGDTAWDGTVHTVLRTSSGRPWLEVKPDGQDGTVRVMPDRISILSLVDAGETLTQHKREEDKIPAPLPTHSPEKAMAEDGSSKKKSYAEIVAEKLIAKLEQGAAPWQMPWESAPAGSAMPINAVTGKRYRGLNALNLMASGFADQRWLTYKQAQSVGAQVRKGERGTPIQYWKYSEEQTQRDENGKPVLDKEGVPVKVVVTLERPRSFGASVFNAEQVDGLPPLEVRPQEWDAIERAERILQSSGADIRHAPQDGAFYRPRTDTIHLPDKGQFPTSSHYYATALHELGHWTGHETRLGRDLANPYGSEAYAKEELRAEIASMIIGDALGIGHDPGQHASYVGSWVKVLRDDPQEIFRASSDAEKIFSYVMAFEQNLAIEQSIEPAAEKLADEGLSTAEGAGNMTIAAGERQYIKVPYRDKQEAKDAGARWDRQQQSWFIPHGVDPSPFAKWLIPEGHQAVTVKDDNSETRQYLAVPYGERAVAKAAGALWDKQAKSWYVDSSADIAKVSRWIPREDGLQQSPAMSSTEEFADALRAVGCIVEGEHPVMDGNKHRIPVAGDKRGEQSGFYVGHVDGHPAGYMKNNRTGLEMKWKSRGYEIDAEQKLALQAMVAAKLAARDADTARLQRSVAERIEKQLSELSPIVEATPYLKARGVTPQVGALTDNEGKTTFIPVTDAEGALWSMQYIQEDGTKRFAKDGRKEGCFHAVGGMNALAAAPVLVISEGYATAATLAEAVEFGTVAAFDAGNLPHVARELHQKWPDKPIVIAGDDDRQVEADQGVNPGRQKALEAAKAVGGVAVFPVFAPGEQAENPKMFTDFNDLCSKSILGADAVKRQIGQVVSALQEGTVKASERGHAEQQQETPRQSVRRSVRR